MLGVAEDVGREILVAQLHRVAAEYARDRLPFVALSNAGGGRTWRLRERRCRGQRSDPGGRGEKVRREMPEVTCLDGGVVTG